MFNWLMEKIARRKMLRSVSKEKREELKESFRLEDKQNKELREKRPFFLKPKKWSKENLDKNKQTNNSLYLNLEQKKSKSKSKLNPIKIESTFKLMNQFEKNLAFQNANSHFLEKEKEAKKIKDLERAKAKARLRA